jgi:hypothetical protein
MAAHANGAMPGAVARRTDMLSPGDVVVGTGPSGAYEGGPRMLQAMELAPEHAQRMTAYRLTWFDLGSQVYYGDTVLWVQT